MELLRIIEYHFHEEEQYVFPQLAALPILTTRGVRHADDTLIYLTAKLRSNMAKLVAEHRMIAFLIRRYGQIHGDSLSVNELSGMLTRHSRFEEEICFPAAIVAGEFIRIWTTQQSVNQQ